MKQFLLNKQRNVTVTLTYFLLLCPIYKSLNYTSALDEADFLDQWDSKHGGFLVILHKNKAQIVITA